MLELLTDVLYIPFKLEIYNISNLEEVDSDILKVNLFSFLKIYDNNKILRLSYRLIKHIIKEYRPNEIYASQWLDFFIMQTVMSSGQVNFLAEDTLTELIDNNKVILETKIKEETYKEFLELLIQQETHKKYVKLLKALVMCEGKAIGNN